MSQVPFYVTAGGGKKVAVKVAVISARRAHNVPLMEGHLAGVPHLWVVPTGQKADYLYAGAEYVVEVGSTQVSHQRNWMLRAANDIYHVQCDDDLRKIQWAYPGQKGTPISVGQAIEQLVSACESLDAYYAGIAPTDNAYFTKNTYNLTGFIRSALVCHRPGSGLMYDNQFPLKEDYDFSCQHLAKYGRVARVDSLLGSFAFQQGSGGCVDYRTPELEADVVARLVAKWPGVISPNAQKPGEVRLRWPATTPPAEPIPAGMFDE